MDDWIHCFLCNIIWKTNKHMKMYWTSCEHMFCNNCIKECTEKCPKCSKLKCEILEISDDMPAEILELFKENTDPFTLINKAILIEGFQNQQKKNYIKMQTNNYNIYERYNEKRKEMEENLKCMHKEQSIKRYLDEQQQQQKIKQLKLTQNRIGKLKSQTNDEAIILRSSHIEELGNIYDYKKSGATKTSAVTLSIIGVQKIQNKNYCRSINMPRVTPRTSDVDRQNLNIRKITPQHLHTKTSKPIATIENTYNYRQPVATEPTPNNLSGSNEYRNNENYYKSKNKAEITPQSLDVHRQRQNIRNIVHNRIDKIGNMHNIVSVEKTAVAQNNLGGHIQNKNYYKSINTPRVTPRTSDVYRQNQNTRNITPQHLHTKISKPIATIENTYNYRQPVATEPTPNKLSGYNEYRNNENYYKSKNKAEITPQSSNLHRQRQNMQNIIHNPIEKIGNMHNSVSVEKTAVTQNNIGGLYQNKNYYKSINTLRVPLQNSDINRQHIVLQHLHKKTSNPIPAIENTHNYRKFGATDPTFVIPNKLDSHIHNENYYKSINKEPITPQTSDVDRHQNIRNIPLQYLHTNTTKPVATIVNTNNYIKPITTNNLSIHNKYSNNENYYKSINKVQITPQISDVNRQDQHIQKIIHNPILKIRNMYNNIMSRSVERPTTIQNKLVRRKEYATNKNDHKSKNQTYITSLPNRMNILTANPKEKIAHMYNYRKFSATVPTTSNNLGDHKIYMYKENEYNSINIPSTPSHVFKPNQNIATIPPKNMHISDYNPMTDAIMNIPTPVILNSNVRSHISGVPNNRKCKSAEQSIVTPHSSKLVNSHVQQYNNYSLINKQYITPPHLHITQSQSVCKTPLRSCLRVQRNPHTSSSQTTSTYSNIFNKCKRNFITSTPTLTSR